MANTLGSLTVDLAANITRFERALSRAEYLARRRSKAIAGALRTVQTTLAGLGVGFSAAQVLGSFADFEKGLVAVGKTANLQGKELQDLGKEIQNIAKVVPVSTQSLLEIAAASAQVGVSGANDILKFTETLGRLQLATDVVGEEGAKSIARLLTVTGESLDTVDKFGAVLTRLGNNAAASESEILDMATRVGQATALFEVSSTEALALGAALKSVGERAEAAGTVLGTTFTEIDSAVRAGGKELETFARIAGLTVDEFRELNRASSVRAFDAFIQGLARLKQAGGDVQGTLEELGLSGDRAFRVLGSLANAPEEITKALRLMQDEMENTSALFEESIVASRTFSAQMQLLRNAADQASTNIGRLIAPAALEAIKAASNAAQVLSDNVNYLKDIAQVAAAVIGGRLVASIAGVTRTSQLAAVWTGTLTAKMVGLSVGLRAATAAGAAFNAVMRFFGGPIGVAISAVAAAFLLLRDNTNLAADAQAEFEDAMRLASESSDSATVAAKSRTEQLQLQRVAALQAAVAEVELQQVQAKANLERVRNARGGGARGGQVAAAKQRVEQLGNAYDILQQKAARAWIEMEEGPRKIQSVGDAAGSAAGSVNELSTALSSFDQAGFDALDAISRQFEALDAAQALKDAGLDDEAFNIKLQLRAELDSEDATRELQRQIDDWQRVVEKIDTGILVGFSDQEIDLIRERILSLQEDIDEALQGTAAKGAESSTALADAFKSAASSIESSITNAVLSASLSLESLKDLANSILKQIAASIIQSTIVGPASQGIQSYFGLTPRAKGGPVYAGQSYLVGEQGPEVLTLGRQAGGFVTPNNKIGGGGNSTVVNITNNTSAEAKVQRSNGPSGREIIDIVIGEVAANIAGGGSIARTMQSNFAGLSRRSIART